MKRRIALCIVAICTLHLLGAQPTTAQWREDLQFLQQTVHEKYPNLFHKVTAAQFDAEVAKLDQRLPQLQAYEIVAEMSRLVAMFRIGHTQLMLTPQHRHGGEHGGMSLSRVPVSFYLFSDGLYIKAADKQYAAAVGGKVLTIGNLSVRQALEAIRPYTVYENEKGFESNFPYYLTIPELAKAAGISASSNNLPVTYAKGGKETQVVFEKTANTGDLFSATGLTIPDGWVDAAPAAVVPLWCREPAAYRYMEFLKDQKTLYVRHSVTLNDGDQTIEQYFNQVGEFIDKNPVEKLVLDVRMNGGGNNYLNKPIITNIIAAKKINQPGKFFCIIGRRTFSACQNLVNELSKYTEVTFVGEPTSENINFYGDTRTETLPNSRLGVNLSWLWWQNLDPRDKRPWMAPHLATALRFEDYQKGNDPAMEAIETARIEKDIEATLRNLVQQGKFDEATDIAKAYIQNPVHQYSKDDLESKINEYGYRMFEKKQFDTANKVLKMNIDLFPESANAYDSYAESFMRMGKNEEAIRYYEMAIAKDEPKGVTAQNARKMLDQLKR